jgi:hypothetical protein
MSGLTGSLPLDESGPKESSTTCKGCNPQATNNQTLELILADNPRSLVFASLPVQKGRPVKVLSIGAKNFRTLQDFNLTFRPNYCAISGRNNAGKSAVVRIIQFFFDDKDEELYHPMQRSGISFLKDATQWSNADETEVLIAVQLDRTDDSEVFFVVETYSSTKILENSVTVRMCQKFKKSGPSSLRNV